MNAASLAHAEAPTMVIERVEHHGRHRADDHVECGWERIDCYFPRHAAPKDGAR